MTIPKITEIESALSRVGGDVFQKFCNHFLYLKLNPNTITPIGSVIGKAKTRKGIPDCFIQQGDYTATKKLDRNKRDYLH